MPLLALAPVHGQLDRVARGKPAGLVAVEDRLHRVVAGREVGQARDGVAEDAGIDDGVFTRPETFDVEPEDLRGLEARADAEARLLLVDGRDDQQEPAVQRPGGRGLRVAQSESQAIVGLRHLRSPVGAGCPL